MEPSLASGVIYVLTENKFNDRRLTNESTQLSMKRGEVIQMPLYEYVCDRCSTRFEMLRPSGRMNDPASCPRGHDASRQVPSTFAALTRDSFGETAPVGGGCGGCAGGCT